MGKLNIQCFTCGHNEVCKLNSEYNAAIQALERVSYGVGDNSVATIRDTKWLDMELRCRHFAEPWGTPRQ